MSNVDPNISIVGGGGSGSGSSSHKSFSVSLTGTFRTYSVKRSSNFNNVAAYTEFSAAEGGSLKIKNLESFSIPVGHIYIYYNNQLVRTIKCHDSQGGMMEWESGNEFTVPLDSDGGAYYSRGLFGMYKGRSNVESTNPYTSETPIGPLSVKVVVDASVYGEFYVGSVQFVNLVMRSSLSITTTNAKTVYYKNEALNTSGLKVYASYKYANSVTNMTAETIAVSSSEVSNWSTNPSNGSILTATGAITVSYGSASGTYNVTVHSVNQTSTTKPTIKSPRNNAIFRTGEQYTIGQSKVYYTGKANGDTYNWENVDVSVTGDAGTAGKQQEISYSVTGTRTGETVTWTSKIDVYNLYKIVLNTTNVTKEFDFNETWSAAGLTLTEYYGDEDDDDAAGTEAISSMDNYDIDDLPLEAGVHTINVTHKTKNKSASFEVCRNGITAAIITLTTTKFEKGSVYPTGVSNISEVLVKRIDNFEEDSDYSDFDFNSSNIELPANIDMDTVGEQELTFKIKEKGQEFEVKAKITIYEYDALVISGVNAVEKLYVQSASSEAKLNDTYIPNLGNLVVKITSSSGGEDITLTRGASTHGYTLSPAWGSNLTVGTETEIEVVSTDYETLKNSFKVKVIINSIKEDGSIIFTPLAGAVSDHFVEVGEVINPADYVLKVEAEFEDGQFYEVSYTAVLREHDNSTTLILTDEDTIGDTYHIDIYVGETLAGTVEVILNGVDEITNVANNKPIYDIGEVFDPDQISYTVKYVNGFIENLQTNADKAGSVTTSRTTPFTKSEAESNNGVVTVSLTIRGVSKSVDITVRELSQLLYTALDNTDFIINGAIDVSLLAFKKKYNDGSAAIALTENEISNLTWVFTDNSDNAISACKVNKLIPESTRMSKVVKVTAKITENGVTVAATTFSINVLAVRNLKLYKTVGGVTSEVEKIYLNQGETLSLVGYAYRFTYNDGTHSTQTNINSKLDYAIYPAELSDPVIGTSAITSHITITDGATSEQVDTADFTVHIHYIDDVETNLDEIVESTYYVGDILDLSTLTFEGVMNSTDEEEEDYPKNVEVNYNVVLGQTNLTTPTYKFVEPDANGIITVSYGMFSESVSFVVNAVVLTAITLITSNAFKSLSNYYDDQYLNLDGLTIRRTYNNGAQLDDVSYIYAELLDENGNAFNKTQQLSYSQHNGKKLYIKYNENGTQLSPVLLGTLTVTQKALTSIEVVQNPTKTTYTYGDIFSLNGLVVKANFDNDNSEVIGLTDLTITGVTAGHTFNPSDDSTFGSITISLSYTYGGVTKTTSFNITLAKPVIAYLLTNAASDAVKKQWQDGDTFGLSGLVVTAVMVNGWSCTVVTYSTDAAEVLNLTNNVISVTGNYGRKTITVTGTNPYDSSNSATVTFDIDVETSGAIVSAIMMLDQDIDYKNYFVGDKYNARGVSWRVTDVDGNTFVSGVFSTSFEIGAVFRSAQRMTITVTYTNGTFSKSETYDIIVGIANLVSMTETNKYKVAVGYLSSGNGVLFEELVHEEVTLKLGKQYDENNNLVGEYYPIFHEDLISVDDNPLHEDTVGYNVYTGVDAVNDCVGYMDMGLTAEDGTVIRRAHVILFDDPLNPIDGDGNIEVRFPHYVKGYAERINRCRFGVVYNNRLFVSGNPDFKNCDWHSGDVNFSQVEEYNNKAIKDYTYFSDLDYCFYGDSDTAIVGYDIYRDGDLIVVKEGSKHQATLYRRTMKLVNATSADGTAIGEDLAEAAFPMYDINSNGGVGGLSNRSIVNFVGETIVLTKNGLKAITNKDDVYNTAKYTFDVSSFINDRIKEEDLKNAFLFVHNETLLLKTNRGIYIGYYGLRNEDNEYEWYFLNNIDADIFFEFDDELYFANNKGEIYRFPFNSKEYKDKPRTFVGVGGTTLYIDTINDKLVASAEYKDNIVNGRPFHLLTAYTIGGVDRKTQIFANLGSFVNKNYKANTIANGGAFDQTAYVGLIDADNNTLEIKLFNSDGSENLTGLFDKQDLFYEGREVFVDNIVGEVYHLSTYTRYFLKKYNEDNSNIYQLVDNNGNVLDLIGISTMRMSFLVNDLAVTYITEVADYNSSGAKEFALLGDHGRKLDLIYYAIDEDDSGSSRYYSGVITKEDNVSAFFVTAPYALGGIALTKTIWEWIIANDTQLASYMDVGYLSSRKQGDYEMVIKSTSGSRQLNFSGMNFEKIQFTSDKLPHVYARHRTVPNVNFIRFLFKNDKDSNMVLTTLNVIYTISEYTKGVK